MAGRLAMRKVQALGALALLLSTFGSGFAPSPATAQAADDLETSALYSYRLDTDAGLINVTADVAVTAKKASVSTRRGTTQYYYQGYGLLIPASAQDISLTQDGTELEYDVVEEVDDLQYIDFSFRRNIFYNQTANVVLSYSLDADGPRGGSLTRVNAAYANFSLVGDPGITLSEFNIYVPDGFVELDISSQHFRAEQVGDETVLVYDTVHRGIASFDIIALQNSDALVTTTLDIDGSTFEIRSWPGDTEWVEFVAETIEAGIPVLTDLIGQEWPVDGTLSITESNVPYFLGYGGWYDPKDQAIEIGDELDQRLLLHELSHAWFNHDLFLNRWISEGLAQTYSAEADQVVTGEDRAEPRVSQFDAASRQLVLWNTSSRTTPETEEWSYEASWGVTDELLDDLGADAMRSVLASAADRVLPYKGEGPAEPLASKSTVDWQTYLDLLEESGEADDVVELFSDWITMDSHDAMLDERAEARDAYTEFKDRSGDWGVPVSIRQEMTDWRFENAHELMDAAGEVLDLRDDLDAVTEESGLVVPDVVELTYEDSTDDFAAAKLVAEDALTAANSFVADQEAVNSDYSFTTKIGLLGTDPQLHLDAATEAFAVADYELAATEGDAAVDMISSAAATGTTRLIAGAAGLLLVLAGVGFAASRRGKGRSDSADQTDSSEGADYLTSSGGEPEHRELNGQQSDDGVLVPGP